MLDRVGALTSATRKSPSQPPPTGSEKVTACRVGSARVVVGVLVRVERVAEEMLSGFKLVGRRWSFCDVMPASVHSRTGSDANTELQLAMGFELPPKWTLARRAAF